ncbi:MAG: DUF655 domain-containing protein [Jaaginema sp. PMC 1079.18]|nr:DUF655 domain-containing protein [Jaaginema sp. PMC 1080.18]MEC4853830.1 DUF655 domain-containing protein [Jaaginema sp. PMC 1079.18]MEC4869124.1 DUF655 domain-containing protein [Jaaginema sp. PMC 1078.18]
MKGQRHLWVFLGLMGLGLILALVAFFWRSSPLSTRLDPLPQDAYIQVYMNQNQAKGADYTDGYRNIERPGDDLEQITIDGINAAQTQIDLAVQELRLPKVAQALANRHQAGVKVRVILENTYSRSYSTFTEAEVAQLDAREKERYDEYRAFVDLNQDSQLSPAELNQRDALIILKNAGIPVIDDTADGSKGSGLMHHKLAIVDGVTVLTGSVNLTLSGTHGDIIAPETRGNANNLLRIQSPQIAQIFTQEFNYMWGDGPGGKPDSLFGLGKPPRNPQTLQLGKSTVTIQFSPISPTQPWSRSSNGLIGQTLSQAVNSVDLALFVFSEQPIVDILGTRQQQGVEVKALIDPSFAFRDYSEGLDMLGVALAINCQYETDNQPWQNPVTSVGIPQLIPGDKLHHKFGVIDQNTVITGSHNWSAAANHNNDETLIVIRNPVVTAHFQREFERLYEKAALGLPPSIQDKIAQTSQTCPEVATPTTPNPSQVINVNTATQAQLETLPGVGPKLAQSIITTRQQQPFTSLEDLQRVPGIGPKLSQSLRDRVSW